MKKEFLMTGSLLLFAVGCGAANSAEPITGIDDVVMVTTTLIKEEPTPTAAKPTETVKPPTKTRTPTKAAPTPKPTARPTVRPMVAPTEQVFNDIPDIFKGKAGNTRWEKNWGDSKTNLWLAFGTLTKIELKGANLTVWVDTQNNGQAEAFTFTITADQPVLFVEPFGNYGKPNQSGGGSWQTGSALEAKAAVEKFYEVGKSGIGFAFFSGNPDSGMLKQNIVWYPK